MRNFLRYSLLASVVAIGYMAQTTAQTPQGFSYQAVLRDSEGKPISEQNVGLKISLQNLDGSTVHYIETHSVTTSSEGVISVTVGEGTVLSGVFVDIPWSGGGIRMRVEADMGAGYTELGTSSLNAVPFALFAADGNPGPQGEPGVDGLSAYQIWLQTNSGTEEDFLASLKGETGEQGPQGDPGPLVEGSAGQTLIHDGTTWSASSNIFSNTGDSVGIGTTTPEEKLHVVGNIKATGSLIGQTIQVGEPQDDPDEPLFVVRNSSGLIVFAVYESGVRVYVESVGEETKGSKGGFAVGGLSPSKQGAEFFRVTPDSVRIYIDTTSVGKGSKGGFAIGGLSPSKQGTEEYFRVTRDSSRIYINTESMAKGTKGGFAIGGLSPSKSNPLDLMYIGPDSARIYIDTTSTGKGSKGGFAIGGLTPSKGRVEEYMRITRDSSRIYVNPSVAGKGSKGGFAVGGLSPSKEGSSSFMFLTPDNYFIGHESGQNIEPTGLFNSTLGYMAGKSLTTGRSNIFIGLEAGLSTTTGRWNTVLGFKAGRDNISGDFNTFLGYYAGWKNTTGGSNVFIGNQSGQANVTGSNNVFLGYFSGYSNLASFNTFLGYEAGYSNTYAPYNSFIGYQAGYSNVDGSHNSFMGYKAGYFNISGYSNVFIGHNAGLSNDIGANNVFIGRDAGASNTLGNNHVIIGNEAGLSLTGGFGNVFIGERAGQNFPLGSRNVIVGFFAGSQFEDGDYFGNVLIGGAAARKINGNNNVIIGDAAGENYQEAGNSGSQNVFIGKEAGQFAGGEYNVYIGHRAGSGELLELNTGSRNVFIGNSAGYYEKGDDKLYIANSGTTSPLVYGDFSSSMLVINGNVSNNGNSRNFFVNGTAGGTGDWYSDSDGRLKSNVTTINSALKRVLKLRGVNFEWSDPQKYDSQRHIGFIAQEVMEVLPEVVSGSDNTKYSMQYAPITALLVEAIKEQQAEIEMLKEKNKELETLKAELEAIKTLLAK